MENGRVDVEDGVGRRVRVVSNDRIDGFAADVDTDVDSDADVDFAAEDDGDTEVRSIL